MKKAFPVFNVILLYLIAIPFVVDVEVYDKLFNDFVAPYYFPSLIVSGVLSIVYAFYLYKTNDENNLKFSMCVSVFCLLPYYFVAVAFWIVMSAFATGFDSTLAVFLLFLVWILFVLWTNAFYGFNLARLKNQPPAHKAGHFIPFVNIVATARLLSKRKAD
ncbi:MAG: hypothetical protein IJI44_06100 [Erysipelotrichaceae bacterium]|nr:hypothetical protein [Erysipelotrichaceae bacterium]